MIINEKQDNAYKQLIESLAEDEYIENIILANIDDCWDMKDYDLPAYYSGRPLTLEEARPYLYGWSIDGGYGGEEVIPFYAWTNKRILFIGTYDGSTWLTSVPRDPIDCRPYTVGGG